MLRLGRRSFLASGVPALTALALTGCRQTSPEERHAMKRAQRAAKVTAVKRRDDKAPPTIVATWDHDVHQGDCTIHAGATWDMDVNGNNQWECQVSSTDTGDDFKLYVYLYDSSFDPNSTINQPLAWVGQYGFDIHDANTLKHWLQVYGPNAIFYNMGGLGPAELLAKAAWAALSCDC